MHLSADVERLAIVYLSVQLPGGTEPAARLRAIAPVLEQIAHAGGPRHHDVACHVDAAGREHVVAICYWLDASDFERWRAASGHDAWWEDAARLAEGVGYAREVLTPSAADFETLISSPDLRAGAVAIDQPISPAPIREHGYWGSMRERLPRAQTDDLAAHGAVQAAVPGAAGRVSLRGSENAAVIRSGQDWSAAEGEERALYLDTVEPALRAGMAFLRDEGAAIGCLGNAYMRLVGNDGAPLDESFGYSLWHSLDALEAWAESHPTHMAILQPFMALVGRVGPAGKVRLYHEVCVVRSDDQRFDYINWAWDSGLPKALAG